MNIPAILLKNAVRTVKSSSDRKQKKHPIPVLPQAEFDSSLPKADYYTFGYAKAEIMPNEKIPGKTKYYVAGYRNNNPAAGILDNLMAKAIWIDDNTGRGGVIFVSVDCVGLFTHDVNNIRKMLESFYVISGCRSINICSTHCHAGIDTMGMWGPLPKSGRNKNFLKIVYDGIVTAVTEAYKNRVNGQIYLGFAKAENMQKAPRPPHVYNDTLTRLRFVPENGGKEIYLVNFGSHPESLLGKNSLISADFPCYMARYINEKENAEMMFFAGAVGGITMLPMDDNNIISTIKTGEKLGEIVCNIKDEQKLTPCINIIRQEIYLSSDNPVFWFASKFGIIPEKMLLTCEGDLGLGLKTEMSYIRLGQLNMLLLPGEIFPELVYGGYLPVEQSSVNLSPDVNPIPLCEIANDKNLVVFGLANGEIGYILAPNDFMIDAALPFIEQPKDKFGRKHYPETNSLGKNTAQKIADTFLQMINKVKNSDL